MDFDKYKKMKTIEYKTHKEDPVQHAIWAANERLIDDTFKKDAFEQLGLTGHPKLDVIYNHAYQHGHHNGYPTIMDELYRIKEFLDEYDKKDKK